MTVILKYGMLLGEYPLYRVWLSMKARCLNPKCCKYPDYGGRGINICKKWGTDFSYFYKWAIKNGYQQGLTIERINNNGNYSPQNCKWVTLQEQQLNKRSIIKVEYKGKIRPIIQIIRELNISRYQAYKLFNIPYYGYHFTSNKHDEKKRGGK